MGGLGEEEVGDASEEAGAGPARGPGQQEEPRVGAHRQGPPVPLQSHQPARFPPSAMRASFLRHSFGIHTDVFIVIPPPPPPLLFLTPPGSHSLLLIRGPVVNMSMTQTEDWVMR